MFRTSESSRRARFWHLAPETSPAPTEALASRSGVNLPNLQLSKQNNKQGSNRIRRHESDSTCVPDKPDARCTPDFPPKSHETGSLDTYRICGKGGTAPN